MKRFPRKIETGDRYPITIITLLIIETRMKEANGEALH